MRIKRIKIRILMQMAKMRLVYNEESMEASIIWKKTVLF
jgi:hypothetical protein